MPRVARAPGCSALAEREHVGAGAGIEEGDFCRVADDAVVLADELIQPWGFEPSAALLVDVEAVVCTRRLSIYEDAEADGSAGRSWRHHEVSGATKSRLAASFGALS